MIHYGTLNKLTIKRLVDFGAYLTDGSNDVLLPRKYLPQPAAVGDLLEVFVYLDSEDRPVATTRKPRAMVGDVVPLTCKEMTRIGAFLDWGLEKDLFVPFKEMNNKQMTPGKVYPVKILLDPQSNRIIGSNRFDRISRDADRSVLEINQQMSVIILERTRIGYIVLADGKYLGILYNNEIFTPIQIGEQRIAHLTRIREDGRLDLRLRAAGHAGALEKLPEIIAALEQSPNHFIPFDADSDALRIKGQFQMSKKQFKMILGYLYKERRVSFENGGTKLIG